MGLDSSGVGINALSWCANTVSSGEHEIVRRRSRPVRIDQPAPYPLSTPRTLIGIDMRSPIVDLLFLERRLCSPACMNNQPRERRRSIASEPSPAEQYRGHNQDQERNQEDCRNRPLPPPGPDRISQRRLVELISEGRRVPHVRPVSVDAAEADGDHPRLRGVARCAARAADARADQAPL
jgi:hypothetical protein